MTKLYHCKQKLEKTTSFISQGSRGPDHAACKHRRRRRRRRRRRSFFTTHLPWRNGRVNVNKQPANLLQQAQTPTYNDVPASGGRPVKNQLVVGVYIQPVNLYRHLKAIQFAEVLPLLAFNLLHVTSASRSWLRYWSFQTHIFFSNHA